MLSRIAAVISKSIETIERERMREIRDRIDRKIMEQLRPKDLFYQILDGLRSLTRYDHSSALLIRDEEDDALKVVAEQIAWKKAKSGRIGLKLPLTDKVKNLIGPDTEYGFDRDGDDWREWKGRDVTWLARLLDYNRADPDQNSVLREGSMLCATLVAHDGLFGVLKIASRTPGALGPYDAELVGRFRSQVTVALQNSRRTEALHARMLEAEKKQSMAELARGVSHDVNNALGSILPLVQQLLSEARSGRIDPAVAAKDLTQIHHSLQVCRRIFGGMLSFARGGARRTSQAQVRPAIDDTLAILGEGLSRRGIRLEVDVPGDLPEVSGGQSDLDQVILNILTNASDAMPQEGVITIRARACDGSVEIVIRDQGRGLSAEQLARIQEPFYTTKPHGAGLGLSICRSILWEMGGGMRISSEPGRGTDVTISVPRASPGQRGSQPRREGTSAESTQLDPESAS
jgi:signal transduction histidine kinase